MEIPLLQDIVILLGLAVGVIYLFQRLKLPTILGFLATGIIFGPSALGLIEASHDIEILSEIGIILLLFIIGLEFSIGDLARIKNVVFIGGISQVFLTIGAVFLIMYFIGFDPAQSLFFGFLVSLSSTAIVLSILQERGMMNSPQGKIALGILIFQDVIVVPMMLLAPMLAGEGGNVWLALGILLIKVIAVVGILLISSRYLVPRLLEAIVKTRSRELFLISIVVICFAVAWGTNQIGLSLSLGAFLAGLIISESEYSHQATGLIIPFREIFTSFFFVSIGMLLDLSFFMDHIVNVLLITVGVIILKFIILFISSNLLRYPLRTNIQTGLTLFQVGEFAFILAAVGMSYELLEPEPYQYFLSVSILTMGLTPFVIDSSDKLTGWLIPRGNFENALNTSLASKADNPPEASQLKDHLIIIGYGLNGRYMAEIAKNANISYVIIDINSENVKIGRGQNEPIYFGDATNPYILEHFHVYQARVAVVAISDPPATKKVVSAIRGLCQTVHIMVRSRFLNESGDYFKLGASEVISEEFETSVEIFTRVLHQYFIPDEDIHQYVTAIRNENYKMLRPLTANKGVLALPDWHHYKVESLRIDTLDDDIVHRSLKESRIKNKYGVTILAIQRKKQIITDIDASVVLEPGDVVHVFGDQEKINAFIQVAKA